MLKCIGSFPLRIAQRAASSTGLMYKQHGEPRDVLSLTERELGSLKEDEVLIKMCAAPINPSDINTIQGVYPVKPSLPAVAGNEGVGRVMSCGSKVDSLKVGDLVIPAALSSGMWQTQFHAKPQNLIRVAHPLPVEQAAILYVNPGTAYRMLSDFCELKSGDIVLQNGSNSAVGIYVIQIAKLLGLRTVNLFRARTTKQATEEMRSTLFSYGATWALTEEELIDSNNSISKDIRQAGPIKLALNCLGGKPAVTQLKFLSEAGTLVSYGAMTRSPIPLPAGPLLFRDIRLRGFWLTRWTNQEPRAKLTAMIDQLAEWFSHGKLRTSPFVSFPLEEWKEAVELSSFTDQMPSAIKQKVMFSME
ncbi:unnamed protein product [Echinostoma caproni]|uniref:Enoyl-[acyl-carrier-protein] reductase, mitochondrial n=1 Tax=Echinostoma caproni TaxID=27848 RepID=A0A183APX4_9TREM|nr:unnamed protein product [Echinostoma caproni]